MQHQTKWEPQWSASPESYPRGQVAAILSSGQKRQVRHAKQTSPFLDFMFFFEECKELRCPAFFMGEGSEEL